MADIITRFQETSPSLDSYWRSVILFGRNVASYKFALAKSLLEIAPTSGGEVTLDALAEPFSRHLCEHLAHSPKQVTSSGSKFLDACVAYNDGSIAHDQLLETTARLGFNNVIDAFHIVNQSELAKRFFLAEGRGRSRRLILTDELYELLDMPHSGDLALEAESRWRLVETAWDQKISVNLLDVEYKQNDGRLYVFETDKFRRRAVTSARAALNGYQKGKCFYCFADISIGETDSRKASGPSDYQMIEGGLLLRVSDETPADQPSAASPSPTKASALPVCEIDHCFPHTLQRYRQDVNLDGIWNLVLSCEACNHGTDGKFTKVPAAKYLARLHTRNEFLINSHHPLRETLMNQTGKTEEARIAFLTEMNQFAKSYLIHTWETGEIGEAAF